MSVAEILWGRPAMQGPHPCWVTPKLDKSWDLYCALPHTGISSSLLPISQLHDLYPLGPPGNIYSLHIQGVFLKNQREGSRMRRYVGFEALI